jgi:Tfp pilus assembly pilus retraction ATPase PilT
MEIDLRKPESLLMPADIDDAILHNVDIQTFKKILLWGKKISVSDVVFQSDMPVMIKVSNLVFPITRNRLSSNVVIRMVGIIYGAREGDDSAYQRIMQGQDNDATYYFKIGRSGEERKGVRYRVNSLRDGEDDVAIVMRLNNDEILKLSEIGQHESGEIYQHMFPMKGLNLVTGSVDSGKTTLIYACLRHFIENDPRSAFIDTYEKPIEGDLRAIARKSKLMNKSVRQCPVPQGASGFLQGIEHSLRKNTDIVLTGEVKNAEDARGLMAGLLATGKLMMATLHTDNVPTTLGRLLEMLKTNDEGNTQALTYDLISSSNMFVSQKLLQTIDLKRVAVNETIIFNNEIRERLFTAGRANMKREMENIMREKGSTMVDKAKLLWEDGVISEETYQEFAYSFGY